jgi:hypothetical protein
MLFGCFEPLYIYIYIDASFLLTFLIKLYYFYPKKNSYKLDKDTYDMSDFWVRFPFFFL